MTTVWYGQAKHRPQQVHNSQQWERAVGGTRHEIRAIYGSSDRATQDHSNDALCHVVTREIKATGEPRRIQVDQFTSRFDEVSTYTPPTTEQIIAWARRAERLHMTVQDYAHNVLGLTL